MILELISKILQSLNTSNKLNQTKKGTSYSSVSFDNDLNDVTSIEQDTLFWYYTDHFTTNETFLEEY